MQGPIDSVVTGPDGRFRFSFPADTTAIHLVSARFAGIEYFSTPVATNPALPDTAVVIVVFDTSAVAPLGVAMRHLVVGGPEPGGGARTVVDLIMLENSGERTRVVNPRTGSAYAIPLSPDATGISVESETDFSAEGIRVRDQTFEVLSPIAPGEKQVLLRYEFPRDRRTISVPFTDSVGTFTLLLEEPDTRTAGLALTPVDTQRIDGRLFQQYQGRAAAGTVLRLEFPSTGLTPGTTLVLLIGGTVSVFAALALVLLRRARVDRPAVPTGAAERDRLISAIAALDAAYRDRQVDLSAEDRSRNRAEREALKDRLRRLLAGEDQGR